jgi:hypothetical protein
MMLPVGATRRMVSFRRLVVLAAFALWLAAVPAAAMPEEPDAPVATVTVQQVPLGNRLTEEAIMVLVGTALIGLGTAVRRAR